MKNHRLQFPLIRLRLAIGAALLMGTGAAPARADELIIHHVRPSDADPAVLNFDEPSVAILNPALAAPTPLVVFLPGTGGKPLATVPFQTVVARQGYRVIGLEYDDVPAVAQVCPNDPDAACSEAFRQMRLTGDGDSHAVHNPRSEGIVARLVAALRALDRAAPAERWVQYLDGDEPAWPRIIVSGLSQGAGMAAYIAKLHPVARVVLFSSPWDVSGRGRSPAPWLSMPSATPPERWYAEYHRRENTADLIVRAYSALKIPTDHILVFDQDLVRRAAFGSSANPFHGSTVRDERYAPEWRQMFGHAPQ